MVARTLSGKVPIASSSKGIRRPKHQDIFFAGKSPTASKAKATRLNRSVGLAGKARTASKAKGVVSVVSGLFPSPSTTGYLHTGVTLTPYTGPDTITSATTIDSKDITGGLIINHSTGLVSITRSRVMGGFGDGSTGIDILGTGPVLIQDVEIVSTSLASNATQWDRTISTALSNASRNSTSLTIRRVHGHGGIRGMDFSGDGEDILVEDSYLFPNYNPGTGERDHTTAIRAAGNTFSITVNNCVLGVGVDCFASGVIAMYPEFGPNSGLTINGGLFIVSLQNDGAFGIAAGYTPPGESPNHDFNVNNLWISTEFYSEGCPSGCAQQWNELTGTNSWNNVKKYNPGQPDHGQIIPA